MLPLFNNKLEHTNNTLVPCEELIITARKKRVTYYADHYTKIMHYTDNVLRLVEYHGTPLTRKKYSCEITFFNQNGESVLSSIKWEKNKKKHNNSSMPALVEYYSNQQLKSRKHYKNNVLFMKPDYAQNKPAVTTYYDNGSVERIVYYHGKSKHRDLLPADVMFNKSGGLACVKFFYYNEITNKYHPSIIDYHENGNVKKTSIFINGFKSSFTMPATREFNEKSELVKEEYYLFGNRMSKANWLKNPAVLLFRREALNKSNMGNNISL